MYRADVVKLMIASPSDVTRERDTIRSVVHEWNSVHSEDRRLVLMPVGWNTHAEPEMGNRPQELLNQQLLADCDFLVAVFWTRIGSPTGRSVSGTVEEIEEHIGCGKLAMVYFSNAPVRPDRLDQAQYEALNQFRRECEVRGLIETYEGLQDFREKIARQLAQKVIRAFNSEIGDAASGLADAEGQRGGESVIQFFTEEARTNRRQIWTTGAETVPRRGTREQRTSTG